jgi:hypothetical protein
MVLSPMRRALVYEAPRNGRSTNSHIWGPSFRKKNRIVTSSTSPVRKFVIAFTPRMALEPNWELVRYSVTWPVHSRSWSGVGANGSVSTQSTRRVKPSCACCERSPH